MLDRRDALRFGLGAAALFVIGPARAETPLQGPLTQGSLLRGKTEPNAAVLVDGKRVRVSPAGNFAFGVAYDRKDSVRLSIQPRGQDAEARSLPIEQREYRVQRINQLPGKYVTPDPSVAARIKRDNQLIGAARAHDTDEEWFADGFDWPVTGPITGVYGSRRILNGEERQPHFGIDIAAAEGVAVKAPVGGIVRLADPDLYFTGGTVILDHGYGVNTSYLHMSRLDVEVGQKVAKGETIGAIGKTGRATGPHMCWRLNWFAQKLDASLVAPKMPG
jgi:murein DD-endopeptidase MepM/ murein hydrolase activator NlpD